MSAAQIITRMRANTARNCARLLKSNGAGPKAAHVEPDLLGLGDPVFVELFGADDVPMKDETVQVKSVEVFSDLDTFPSRESMRLPDWNDLHFGHGRRGRRPRYKDVRRGGARMKRAR
ncbi:MAG: hypothetical protein HY372_03355 [Candidatus Andersenbacteria bacterium]|nr:hypothetical protein [Candidatus Andersenbacteria bacterium]